MDFQKLADFQDRLQDLGIGGNDCAIYVGFEPVYRHFSGWQNIEKKIHISADTLYRMFSMTKPITCTAAMQLFEQGAFLLNDELSDYLPEYKAMKVRVRRADGSFIEKQAENPILIQHLFSMTAGLDYDLSSPPILSLAKRTNMQFTTRQAVAAIAENPLLNEPGTHWYYSLAHDVLGALIEELSGMTFGEYLKKNIFQPLGMNDSWFVAPESEQYRYCHRYGFDENHQLTLGSEINPYQLGPNMESGGAGLTMTVDDYARFACTMTNRGAYKDGTRILAGRTVDLMRTNRLNQTQLEDIWQTPARQGYGYGLGVRTMYDRAAGGTVTPVGEFGWGGAWGTYVLMDPENKVTIVYAEQGVDTKGPYIQRRIRNMAYSALEWEGLI